VAAEGKPAKGHPAGQKIQLKLLPGDHNSNCSN
jgi:hypothetical protein